MESGPTRRLATGRSTVHIATHRLEAVTVDSHEVEVLEAAVRSPQTMLSGTTMRTTLGKRARILGSMGLMRFLEGADGGRAKGTWIAYLTCNGFNALWRYAGDTHVDGCGGQWTANGTCASCHQRRRLDLPAYRSYLDAMSAGERRDERSTAALWCVEHGYLCRGEITTTKICRLPGTPLHDGGLDRVGDVPGGPAL